MGFPLDNALRAVHLTSSVEEAVEFASRLDTLLAMGYHRAKAEEALVVANMSLRRALDYLNTSQ
jgi:Holliday junction resolvasome RuvABC DNA-binding subunit